MHQPTSLTDIQLSTLIECSPLLGHPLEDRACIRDRQDLSVVEELTQHHYRQLSGHSHVPQTPHSFHFGCIDFLIFHRGHHRQALPIEINGTGMSGITNLPTSVLSDVLNNLNAKAFHIAQQHKTQGNSDTPPIILVPFSGTQTLQSSGSRQLLYEPILYAQALKSGLCHEFGHAKITLLSQLIEQRCFEPTQPTVVLGFLKDFIPHLDTTSDGMLTLFGHIVSGSTHDQFCDYLLNQYPSIRSHCFFPINQIIPATTDKGASYALFNQLLSQTSYAISQEPIHYAQHHSREALIDYILSERAHGRGVVIKPHSGGLGRGIDFFIHPETPEDIAHKVDASIESIQRYYGVENNIFPYTACEFIDSDVIQASHHPLHHHKYECRVFVYRNQDRLYAVPSIAKIAYDRYDPTKNDRLMLLNNIAAAKRQSHIKGTDYMLPLTQRETWDFLGLDRAFIEAMCDLSLDFIEHCITQTQPTPHEPLHNTA